MAGLLSAEATALCQEPILQGQHSNRRDGVLSGYAKKVADSHLTLRPVDDDTATTQAWLFGGGGTNANPSVFTIGAGLTLSINTSGAIAILGTTPASTSITVPGATTRGGVRRLLAALGVAFTG